MTPQGSLLSGYMKACVLLQSQMHYPPYKKLMPLLTIVSILLIADKNCAKYITTLIWIFSLPMAENFKISFSLLNRDHEPC